MNTTLNTLMTAMFFVPVALMVVTNLLTARTSGPLAPKYNVRRVSVAPQPTNRARVPAANDQRFLEAA
jgi:hypothetical protein